MMLAYGFKKAKAKYVILVGIIFCVLGFLSCGAKEEYGLRLPEILRSPEMEDQTTPLEKEEVVAEKEKDAGEIGETRFSPTPKPPIDPLPATKVKKEKKRYEGPAVEVNFESLPLPAFINEIYGNILKVSFKIDPALQKRQDLVTVRAAEPQTPDELDRLARQVMGNYGVEIRREGELLYFTLGKPGAAGGGPPLIISGRTLPEVPISHRPVFQIVPLKVVRNIHVTRWVGMAYGNQVSIQEDPDRNAVILMGTPEAVEEALKAVDVLDRPFMRGRHSFRIDPVYLKAKQLTDLLVEVLNTEGYSASNKPSFGSIIVLPVEAVNAVLVFTSDARSLNHVRQWAEMLDRPGRAPDKEREEKRLHYYQVRNTEAGKLAEVLNKVLGDIPDAPEDQKGQRQAKARSGGSAQASDRRLVVDEVRNALIFSGGQSAWEQILPIVREMDSPSRMVLIEVTVAEITLDDDQELGVEWLLTDLGIKGMAGVLGTIGGLGVGSGGLSYTLDNAGQTRAILNAFAQKSLVTILSTPRVMVKSGETASIDVGTEVPTVTRQSTSSDTQQAGTSGLIQEIQYRKTGVLLQVKPVVHSGNRVDLEITQEVSETKPAPAGGVNSPSIFTRKISTSLGLRDGGSVLLGGLISSSGSKGYSGVPGLSEIPVVGRVFRVEKDAETRTELVMLIVPYVIESNREAEAITEAFKKNLGGLETAGESP